MMDLTRKYRPTKLSQMIGATDAVRTLKGWIKAARVPQYMIFSGPSGCGKTTAARIIRERIDCVGSDYREINAAESRGIDTIRDIVKAIDIYPLSGESRLWVIDEAHQLTRDAQEALLKSLEDASEWSYVILCTTNPGKLIKTIHTRCNEVTFRGLLPDEIKALITKIWAAEDKGIDIDDEIQDMIVERSDGSARKAVKMLHQIYDTDDKDEQIEALGKFDAQQIGFDLVKVLMPFNGPPDWNSVKKVLAGLTEEDPEGLRRLILKVCQTHMLKGGMMAGKAFMTFQSFRDSYFETGRAGLVASCFECTMAAQSGKGGRR